MKLPGTIDVLIGGYVSEEAAEEDYNAVLECGGHRQGAVIVSTDLEGNLSVEQSDHMVSEGAGGLGAIGFVVGLIVPPADLGTTTVGAAIGAVAAAGELLHHEVKEELGPQAGQTIPIGGAGLIVAYSHTEADKVEPAVTRAEQKASGEAEGRHTQALNGAIADAHHKLAEKGA